MTNRQLAAQETRRKLVETAKQIIYEKGLTNTTVDEITEKCGVSKGTFYTYFKRKEDVVFELSRGMFYEIMKNAKAFNGNIMEQIEYYMINFAEYIEKSGVKLCQEWMRNVVCPELVTNEYDKVKLKKNIENTKELLNYGIEKGELKKDCPIELIADCITDLLYGQALCWAMSGGSYSYTARTKDFCGSFLGGLLNNYLIEGD